MDLTRRQKEILKTVIEQFTCTAEPVGSKALIPLLSETVSSATIRNELAYLEKQGLLEKTHTSSGRIPSKKGYRYYVENLMTTELDPAVEVSLKAVFSQRHLSLEEAVSTCCSILSEMTHLTSIVIGPEEDQTLVKVSLIPINRQEAVCVLVTSTGHTENRMFHFAEDISLQDLSACTDLFNEQLYGVKLSEFVERMKEIEPMMAARISRHEVIFEAFVSAFMTYASSQGKVYGRANMLTQPEFSDPARLTELMSALENASLFHEWTDRPGNISVPVGEKNELIQIGDCSVISSRFRTGANEQGQLMVIGPNRMPYAQVVALMECMSSQIEEIFGGRLSNEQGESADEQETQTDKTGRAA
jgi:heat-inducible transcriptional repressor